MFKRQRLTMNKISVSPHSHYCRCRPQDKTPDDQFSGNPRYFHSPRAQGFCPEAAAKAQPMRAQEHGSRSKPLTIAIIVILFFVFAYAACQVTVYSAQTIDARRNEDTIAELITENEPIISEESSTSAPNQSLTATASPVPTAVPVAEAAYMADSPSASVQTAAPEILIQFINVLTINPDTVGQLHMGESINTYVVQRDNSYYLRHSFYGEYSISGAIFMDIACSIYPQSRNLIIHGHNMQNGTSFGKLSRFEDLDYLNQYPTISFSTLYESANYVPFAVVYYSINPESEEYLNLYQVNYLSDDKFVDFVQTVKSRSVYHLYTSVAKTDKILTITTCATEDPNMRFAVFAVKIIS